MNRRSHGRALGLALLAVVAFVALPRAQGNMEEQARRQLQSGLDFYRAGKYSEALKDFQTVAEGYPNSSVADDALLAIATYQLEIQRDPIAARATADSLIKKYATSDGAPMGYVIMGRATIEIDQTPAGLDSALASFDRVPRLFPSSDAVAPALYYGAEVDRRAGRREQALDRLRDVGLQYPRSVWASRAALLEARLLVAGGEPKEAMRALQRVVGRFGNSAEVTTARAWNTALYRLYIRAPGGEPAYGWSGKSIGGPVQGRFQQVASIAIAPDGRLGVATRGGILVFDDKGVPNRQAAAMEPRQFNFDNTNRFIIAEKSILLRETEKGMQRFALTAATMGGPKLLQDISAGGLLSTGEYVIADRELRGAYRFSSAGQYLAAFASGRITRIAVSVSDQVAMLDVDTKSVIVSDRAGKMPSRIAQRGTGYEMNTPSDIGFDAFDNVYVLDRDRVLVFAPGGKLLTIFTPGTESAIRNGQALALDAAARLYIYDEAQGRVAVYQ